MSAREKAARAPAILWKTSACGVVPQGPICRRMTVLPPRAFLAPGNPRPRTKAAMAASERRSHMSGQDSAGARSQGDVHCGLPSFARAKRRPTAFRGRLFAWTRGTRKGRPKPRFERPGKRTVNAVWAIPRPRWLRTRNEGWSPCLSRWKTPRGRGWATARTASSAHGRPHSPHGPRRACARSYDCSRSRIDRRC